MTVYRYRDGEFEEVATVETPADEAVVKVRRESDWEEIWPTSDRFVPVDTLPTESTTDSTAELRGELTGLEGADEAEVWFRYRLAGEEPPADTATETRSTTGEFTATAEDLLSGRAYDVWALATVGESTFAGRIRTFTTA